jgi:hypothetical protein
MESASLLYNLLPSLRQKNKCGLGQPPKPHCYRERSDCRLSPGAKDHRATALRKVLCIDAHLKLALQGSDSALSSSLEGGFLWRPQSPGTGTLDMHRVSPDDSLSKIIGNAEPLLGPDAEHLTFLTASTLR